MLKANFQITFDGNIWCLVSSWLILDQDCILTDKGVCNVKIIFITI